MSCHRNFSVQALNKVLQEIDRISQGRNCFIVSESVKKGLSKVIRADALGKISLTMQR
jgi:hypothetical protein